MTRYLASVSNLHEAATILAAGADIIDIKDPNKGALGAVDIFTASEIVKNIGNRAITSATIGDLPMDPHCISQAIKNMRPTGVDIIKVGVFSRTVPSELLYELKRHAKDNCCLVLVFFADMQPQLDDFSAISAAGIYGVMLDTANKTKGSLRTILNDSKLGEFIKQVQSCGLMAGLAGSLHLSDIQPLLKLHPDYLGFRSALCDQHMRKNRINIHAAHNIRALIPVYPGNNLKSEQLTVIM